MPNLSPDDEAREALREPRACHEARRAALPSMTKLPREIMREIIIAASPPLESMLFERVRLPIVIAIDI